MEFDVEFDYVEGEPDYKYYQISRVVQYNKNSLEGVIMEKINNLT